MSRLLHKSSDLFKKLTFSHHLIQLRAQDGIQRLLLHRPLTPPAEGGVVQTGCETQRGLDNHFTDRTTGREEAGGVIWRSSCRTRKEEEEQRRTHLHTSVYSTGLCPLRPLKAYWLTKTEYSAVREQQKIQKPTGER